MADPSYDWAALYQKHRDAMYGVAYEVLRGSGRVDLAADAVQEAMVSLMKAPPAQPPRSWEALLVATSKRRALDIVRSAAVVRGVEYSEEYVSGGAAPDEDDAMDRFEKMARARPAIARLDTQEHYVLTQYIVLDRPRGDVAAELGVTPARISQISTKVLSKINAAVEGG
ncbi:sigma-70 family RNA polymerase sigma factor [Microbacterium sp. MYb45]|uniref:sigma-70 family RNA polymerase sigma factor n=1 Tax=Microbacterium sp. MYb45 TaxID=1827294 RepID=UPI000CFE80D1|nr:sigma-70 family RNA polymerase sigma factor [Microbacterium sp. MYb45]PRB65664.1 RNA polymerase subunit sigma-70 [Microbacterium sp. MYb45]